MFIVIVKRGRFRAVECDSRATGRMRWPWAHDKIRHISTPPVSSHS